MPSPEGEGGPPLVVDEVLQRSLHHHLIEEINESARDSKMIIYFFITY